MSGHLQVRGLSKSYRTGAGEQPVLHNIDFEVAAGEFVAVLGYSGAGKTTLVSLLAGLLPPDQGEILLDGAPVRGPGPERGVVFQNYALLPWLSVRGNIQLAVDATAKQLPAAQRRQRVQHYIEMVGLSPASERRPAELSGGMRQRVAVARALAMQPDVLLLDEPLSALDALTRAKLQDELAEISQREKRSMLLISNDVDEAILLADRILLLSPGPAARLSAEFKVELPRPRDRAASNSDPAFIRLRGEIIRQLVELGAQRQSSGSSERRLPPVTPISQRRPPKAYRRAAQAHQSERYVEFSQVSKRFATPDGPLTAVENFDLKVGKGEFICLIGHSGCGKSTVLSMAAGLLDSSGGGVILDGREVAGAGPDRAVVFQSPSLMPWLTARENVALGVDRVYPDASPVERREVVEYYLERVGLADCMHSLAASLSNGMRQRVGIARAFALSPKLLLLDEPFGMLDSLTRWELQDVLMEVWARTQVTTLCITHDVDEAILLADRVVMMSNGPRARIGNIMQVDLPRPRQRKQMMQLPEYYAYREELLDFLEAYEGGAHPSAEQLTAIADKRARRLIATTRSAA